LDERMGAVGDVQAFAGADEVLQVRDDRRNVRCVRDRHARPQLAAVDEQNVVLVEGRRVLEEVDRVVVAPGHHDRDAGIVVALDVVLQLEAVEDALDVVVAALDDGDARGAALDADLARLRGQVGRLAAGHEDWAGVLERAGANRQHVVAGRHAVEVELAIAAGRGRQGEGGAVVVDARDGDLGRGQDVARRRARAADDSARTALARRARIVVAGRAGVVVAGRARVVVAGRARVVVAGRARVVVAGRAGVVVAGRARVVVAGRARVVVAGVVVRGRARRGL